MKINPTKLNWKAPTTNVDGTPIGHSGSQFVSIAFAALPNAQVPSRLTGRQTYGPWILVPEVSNLKLYSRHQCATGEVVTNNFDGTIVTLKTENTGE